jgi:uncharacterized protein (DUF305 family)
MTKLAYILAAQLLVLTCGSAWAQETKAHDHSTMQRDHGGSSASTEAYKAANAKMHEGMAIQYSGDADVDFVRGMIAHHQGAIDMAKVELKHGRDAKLRKLAEQIIEAQQAEIAEMQAWLKANGH